MSANGWPGKPGVPVNPERDGWHWLRLLGAAAEPHEWLGTDEDHGLEGWNAIPERDARQARYLGPCATPAEVAALVAAARREGFDVGFNASGEGWNGEHPGDVTERDTYPKWRDLQIHNAIRARGDAP